MLNQSMAKKLRDHEAINISQCPREGKFYHLSRFVEDVDYCDADLEVWMWSIGQRKSDGAILASRGTEFYQNPEFECLWLR